MNKAPNWGKLPALVITDIFKYLSFNDRINASSICWDWRYQLFQPRFFKNVTFNITNGNDTKNNFYNESLATIVSEATITFDNWNLYALIYKLSNSNCLTSLHLKPKQSLVTPGRYYSDEEYECIHQFFVEPIKLLLNRRKPSFKELDLGSCEVLSWYAAEFLKTSIKPQDLKHLGFASIKQDPSNYALSSLEFSLFEKCMSLQVLSLDYDILCDQFIETLQLLPLKKLIIHVHGLDEDHQGISENAWANFREKNSSAEVHLSLVYAYEAVNVLHSHIFRPSMPLSHLKVLFCHFINLEALEYLSNFYKDSLKSVIWVDSGPRSTTGFERNVMDLYLITEQDPLVMMAWRCEKLYEIIIHGYVLDPHNLVGISRLRGSDLKKLEVSILDLPLPSCMLPSFIEEISTQLDQKWFPLNFQDLHPAVGLYSVNDELRNEYILDLVRSDMKN